VTTTSAWINTATRSNPIGFSRRNIGYLFEILLQLDVC